MSLSNHARVVRLTTHGRAPRQQGQARDEREGEPQGLPHARMIQPRRAAGDKAFGGETALPSWRDGSGRADGSGRSIEEAPMPDDLWYKDAVFYELHVKAYADANGDGIGDFPGL